MLHVIIYTKKVWKPLNVEGIERGLYVISNYGEIMNIKRNKLLKQQLEYVTRKGKDGKIVKEAYYRISLQCEPEDEREERRWNVHRLVALTYVHNQDPEHKTDVNHLDGDKKNNFAGNLEWCTKKENLQHAVDSKLHWQFVGEKHPNSIYTNEYVLYIDSLLSKGLSSDEVYNDLLTSYPQFTQNKPRKNVIQFIGRVKRRDRYQKILDNKSSTTIERNID